MPPTQRRYGNGGRRRSGIAQSSRAPAGSALTRALKTSETVARDIVHDIVSRGLQTGDRLPAEAAMLEQYGVSRESLREGLRLLEVQGLITIRQVPVAGRASARSIPPTSVVSRRSSTTSPGAPTPSCSTRGPITEPILAERAARNDDRDTVRRTMAPFVGPPDRHGPRDKLDFVDSHVEFHAVVATLANNRVLELMLETTGQIVTHHVVVNADPRD